MYQFTRGRRPNTVQITSATSKETATSHEWTVSFASSILIGPSQALKRPDPTITARERPHWGPPSRAAGMPRPGACERPPSGGPTTEPRTYRVISTATCASSKHRTSFTASRSDHHSPRTTPWWVILACCWKASTLGVWKTAIRWSNDGTKDTSREFNRHVSIH